MKPTIRSIAAAAGVSRGTVDRVINNRPNVSPAVRARVQRIAQEMGYRPAAITSDSTAIRIGVLVPQWEVSYFTEKTRQGIERAARLLAAHEVRLVVEELGSRSTEEYVKRCESLLSQDVRGMVINAPDNVVMQAEVARITAAGVPVTTYNADIPGSDRICFVGQNEIQCGRIAGGLMHMATGGQGSLLIITGNMEFHRRRVDGFCSRLVELGYTADRFEIIECYERYDLTCETVASYLREHASVSGIYMSTESVLGCMHGLSQSRVRRPVHVIANDLTPLNRKMLRSGRLDFVLEQEFSAQVYEAIMLLQELLVHDRRPRNPVKYVHTTVITPEMV
ncbi:LacI family DNA-binding transcriptional regulator [Butyricicoccus pullicaecorum]|nr:LacI family DNA-binding transcriptional regulator [Butyricicoccus pullicaecorum]